LVADAWETLRNNGIEGRSTILSAAASAFHPSSPFHQRLPGIITLLAGLRSVIGQGLATQPESAADRQQAGANAAGAVGARR
jgi:hypothetical protein